MTLASVDSVYMSIYGTAAADDAANRYALLTPTGRFDVNVPQSVVQAFSQSTSSWRTSLPFDPATNTSQYVTGNNANDLNFAQILGFQGIGNQQTRQYGWFTHVSRIMQTYCTFFRDTVSLGSITTTGIGANYVTTKYVPKGNTRDALLYSPTVRPVRFQANAAVTRYDLHEFTDVWSEFYHTDESLGEIGEQYAQITQLDVNWIAVASPDPDAYNGPLRGIVATGPLEQRLVTRISPWLNVHSRIPGLITGYYHSITAMHT